MVLTLLVLTGLGVFRLYFGFDWTAGDDSGQLFTLQVKGGQSLNIFDAAPFGRAFWITQAALIALCMVLPLFRIAGALILAVLSAVLVYFLYQQQYMGDSVMAVWGAPMGSDTHAFDALCAALDIQKEVHELNQRYRQDGLPEASMGIGISTGPAMVGPLGSEHRMDYTVIGDTVNVAQRLEVQTRKYKVPIIVGGNSVKGLPDMLFRELDTVKVKGRQQTVTMYQPLCALADASETLLANLDLHERAMAASVAERWDEATDLFGELRDSWGPTDMYDLYLRGIEQARR